MRMWGEADSIEGVGLKAHHELVIHWRCVLCRRHAYVVRSLSDLWRDYPERQGVSYEPYARFTGNVGCSVPA